ncbi:MAG: hypothetical protein JSU96_21135 [Acidobacteriota bacterium]|nr:MAG: hypothetical protein JSU96_21135 [Acidobacteriota bacterium]
MSFEKVGRDACKRLRTKGMFIESAPDPTVPNTSDGFFWCTHTMNCLGPDGSVAEKEKCKAGRECFESR